MAATEAPTSEAPTPKVKQPEVNTTYEQFSLEPIYVDANREFVGLVDLSGAERLLDLACGAGTVSELLLEAAPQAHLNGVDLDPVQVGLSTQRFVAQGYEVRRGFDLANDRAGGKPVLTFGVGSADELPFPDDTFDSVTISHAIHLMPDLDRLLTAVRRVLKPGGLFGFNTAYYAGCMPPGTDRVYFDWLRMATDFIRTKSDASVAAGGEPIRRDRSKPRATYGNQWVSPEAWRERLASYGFSAGPTHQRLVKLDARCLAMVGAYGGMAEVLLSGFPVEDACEALLETAEPALAASGATAAPRNYLEMWSRK